MKKTLVLLGIAVLAGGAFAYSRLRGGDERPGYRFVTVERGDVESTVNATGTLAAVSTVQVGTQISGQIAEILADFNDRVRRGQLIARIDPTLLRQTVREAEASLDRGRAELDRVEREYGRAERLLAAGLVTENDFNTAQYNLAAARAAVASAEASLARAQQNLAYADIYSPIDGVVIERNVDVGQTVAASLAAPQLFLIAEDLSKMEILVSVDESDIGKIRQGMPARFTVQAYPDATFRGAVRQVRLQSTIQENVVNYTAVVEAGNDDGRLLPGMTATVDFLVETAHDVLKVANAALRFRPTEEMIAELRRSSRRAGGAEGEAGGSAGVERRAPPGGAGGGSPAWIGRRNGGGARDGTTRLWYLDERGRLAVAPVRPGVTDGSSTAIEPLGDGPSIEAGREVIAGVTQSAQSTAASPFQSPQSPGRPRPGGF